MPFRLQNSKVHLTYKGHLDLANLLSFLNKLIPRGFKHYSLVHENGQEDLNQFVQAELGEPGNSGNNVSKDLDVGSTTTQRVVVTDLETVPSVVQYAHTHVLLEANAKITTKKCDFFDFEGVHPNIKLVLTVAHFLNCWKYHSKAPIKMLQSLNKPIFNGDDHSQIRACKSLAEACKLLGIVPKTVGDLVHLRKDQPEVEYLPMPIVNKTEWLYAWPEGWNCLFMTGASGIGKTRWVMDNCEHPLFVSHMEDLKRLKVHETDCIIFDDMLFKGIYTLEQCIQLCDVSFPRTIAVKYGSITIPAGLKRIFTSNREFEDCFPEDTYGALKRRVTIFRCVGKLYQDITYQNRVDPLEYLNGIEASVDCSEEVSPFATESYGSCSVVSF